MATPRSARPFPPLPRKATRGSGPAHSRRLRKVTLGLGPPQLLLPRKVTLGLGPPPRPLPANPMPACHRLHHLPHPEASVLKAPARRRSRRIRAVSPSAPCRIDPRILAPRQRASHFRRPSPPSYRTARRRPRSPLAQHAESVPRKRPASFPIHDPRTVRFDGIRVRNPETPTRATTNPAATTPMRLRWLRVPMQV